MFTDLGRRALRSKNLTATLFVAVVPFGIGIDSTSAREISVYAGQDTSTPSSFSFDFGELGGVASATIADTNLSLTVDPDMGTARMASYAQEIEPILLPGGISTGNLYVEVVEGSSTGTFDSRTGVFNTTETYAIHFEGDLSLFGLTSPVMLESSSTGTVEVLSENDGTLRLDWNGEGELANPQDPSTPIEFTYACEVNTAFAPEPEQMIDIALIPFVENLKLSRWLNASLVGRLDRASQTITAGRDRLGIRLLDSFINKVEGNRRISPDDAAAMINTAEGAIILVQMGNSK